jgi:MFS family permease
VIRAGRTRPVLALRDFRLVLLAKAVSVVGDRMVAVALAFAVLEVGGSASSVGLVLAAGTVPLVASVLVGGVVADRITRRTVMIAADVVRVATQGAMAALLVAGVAEVWSLAVLAALTGIATGFFNPASTALLPEVVPPDLLQPANALRSAVTSAGEIAGPLLAGVLVAAFGSGWAIAVDAGTFALSAAFLLAARVPERARETAGTFLADLRDGWDAFRARRWVWTFVGYFALANMCWAAWSALGPIVAERELGGAGAWGTILAAIGVGALAGSLLATRIEPSRPLVVVALVEGLFALPLAFLAGGAHVAVLVVAGFLSGVGLMVGTSVWDTTLQRRIPAASLSRVSSYDWFGSFAFYPLGLALWGPVAALLGVRAALWLAFGVFVALAAVLLALPDTRRLSGPPLGGPAPAPGPPLPP